MFHLFNKNILNDLVLISSVKWGVSGKHLVENAPNRPNIYFLVVRLFIDQLRGNELNSSSKCMSSNYTFLFIWFLHISQSLQVLHYYIPKSEYFRAWYLYE